MNGEVQTPNDAAGQEPSKQNGAAAADAATVESKPEAVTPAAPGGATVLLLEQIKRLEKKIANVEKQTVPTPISPEASILSAGMATLFGTKGSLDQFLADTHKMDEAWAARQKDIQEMGDYWIGSPAEFAAKNAAEKYLAMERYRMQLRQRDERRIYNYLESYFQQYFDVATHGEEVKEGEKGKEKDGEDKPENAPGVWAPAVSLSHIPWKEFMARASYNAQLSTPTGPFVIDVLEGEPRLPQRGFSYWGYNSNGAGQDEVAAAESKKQVESGHGPLPERIRIHSRPLMKIVEKIHGTDITISDKNATVLLRPFKCLTFYEDKLREKYVELEAQFGPKEGHVEDVTEKAEKVEKAATTVEGSPASGIPASGKPNGNAGEVNTDKGKDDDDAEEGDEDKKDEQEDTTNTHTAFEHLNCLLEFFDKHIVAKQKYLTEPSCKVHFADLWHLFKPGTHVIESGNKHLQCYRVIHVRTPRHKAKEAYNWSNFRGKGQTETRLMMYCVSVDFDGKSLGPVAKTVSISPYEGSKDVATLPVYPLKLSKDSGLRDALINRGKKFLQVAGVKHMHFSGLTLEKRDEVDSQVVIDFAEAFNANEKWKPEIDYSGDSEEAFKKSTAEDTYCNGACCTMDEIHHDEYVDGKQNERFIESLLPEMDEDGRLLSLAVVSRVLRKDRSMHITEDDYLIMSYRVFGFVLRSKSWAKLDLGDLMDVDEYRRKQSENGQLDPMDQKQNAFDSLVFPKDDLDRKEIIRSLVAQHFQDRKSITSREEQVDIVKGKGKGLIILLHGAPGVGKTTTAEGIADLFNKPLFQITCGDLGTNAKDVDRELEKNFSLANKWESILLLDEADVFLARRTPQDFVRNGLVAVFLRVLEYYAGILFLTTNRIGDFDEAFSSRIHVSLYYPELDRDSALEIFTLNWKIMEARFRKQGRVLVIEKEKIAAFVSDYWRDNKTAHWNGRQIRNACQTALALAESEAQAREGGVIGSPKAKATLRDSHIKTVAKAYLGFMRYLDDVRDADQEKWAYMMGIRRQANKDASKPETYGQEPPSFRRGGSGQLAERRAQFASRYQRDPYYQPPPPQGHHQGDGSGSYGHLATPDRQLYRGGGGGGYYGSPSPEPQYPMSHPPPPSHLQPQPQAQPHGWSGQGYPGGPGPQARN
ncbi:hypothetical protein B0I35DRAFT_482168 [Stachybotrys elegans]|uniref:AAA+ ATPase domain-containing protein n=1 Tax=Stachybotrys elegans TaxID=80388 RepID=A0A8K0SLH1_9HYPO|nr:hypothetical protein B0I35DRAFT_482168 [Stachybotrys elegans]